MQIPKSEFMIDIRVNGYEKQLEKNQGIYMIYNDEDILLYVGKSKDIRNRIKIHMNKADSNPLRGYNHNFHYVTGFYVKSYLDLSLYEMYIINTLKPKLNIDNVFTYKTERYLDKLKSSTAVRLERERELEEQKMIDNTMIDFNL